MDTDIQKPRDHRFAFGLVTGAVVGAALALWVGSAVVEGLRRGLSQSAERVGQAVADLSRQGRDTRDDLADAVVRGAHQVERFAEASKSGRPPAGMRGTRADQAVGSSSALHQAMAVPPDHE
jgi:hypothetical protein